MREVLHPTVLCSCLLMWVGRAIMDLNHSRGDLGKISGKKLVTVRITNTNTDR